MKPSRLAPLALLGLVGAPAAGHALTRPAPADLQALGRESRHVVAARIVRARAYRNEDGNLILTEYVAVPYRQWKGGGAELRFTVPGGELDGVGLVVPGMPRVRPGADYLLALAAGAHGLEPAGVGAGVWQVRWGKVEGLGLALHEIADALAGRRSPPGDACPHDCVPAITTAAGLPLRWPGPAPMGEPYLVNPAPPVGCASYGEWQELVAASAAAWNDVRMGFCFAAGGSTPLTSKGRQPDGSNVVSVGSAHGALAFTTIWYDPATGNVIENDMVVDPGKGFIRWGCGTSGPIGADDYDLFATVIHELGHFLVLDDVYDAGCEALTMFGVGFRGDIEPRTLEPADICGAQALYGSRDQRCAAGAAAQAGAGAEPARGEAAVTELMTAGPGGIRLTLSQPGDVKAAVYDLAGRLVFAFPTLRFEAGTHTLRWGGRGEDGGEVTHGIYFVRVWLDGRAGPASKVLWVR